LKRLPSRVKRAARYEIHAHWRRQPIVQGSVFYESFSGNGMLDNPEAIFRELLASPDLGHLTHIWALSDLTQYRAAVEEFSSDPRVSFVRYGSAAYYRALATSQYLVNNATFPPDFSKRPGQVYLNTWHGTPLKRMGYDIEDGALATANIIRNFVQADYLLSANPFMSEQMYETGYKLTGIYRGTPGGRRFGSG
jgi:CDP-glycerol glycerophosphotransferase (TagB/SpsB family)